MVSITRKVKVLRCDKCGAEPAITYTLSSELSAGRLDLCTKHAKVHTDAFGTARPPGRMRQVVTLEEIEALKKQGLV